MPRPPFPIRPAPFLLAVAAVLLCYAIARIPREVHPLDLTFNSLLDITS